ncbi:MAG TPA: hypothetical protein VLB80_01370 [Candidatus Babeliales bacterium]|nr:hypothetical protein [Candidatus Babeliales bacterium]
MNCKNNTFLVIMTICFFVHTFSLSRAITLFSHGIADTGKQIYKYTKTYIKNDEKYYNNRYLITTPTASFNYPDATTKFYRVNYNETSFGQKNEISCLNKAYQKTLSHYGNDEIILFGISRGASNALIFSGLYQLDNVKALLLESPYNSMSEVIEYTMQRKNLCWLPLSYGETIAECIFKKYTRYGYSPKNCIENISKNIPILIVCSKEDNLVPVESSINVYKKLVESGHKHAYIFITDYGKHAKILQDSDGEKYQWVVNAFYKKYNLPHCSLSAANGEILLSLCQPQFN